jgi:hypothetical protein
MTTDQNDNRHTPGPWKLSSWTGSITAENGRRVVSFDIESTRFADAKLMAAAPEMFELLETIENDDGSVPPWLWQRIKELLDKVKGNQ